MVTTLLQARIDANLKNAVEEYCKAHNQTVNYFVQEALLDRLEELHDIEDIRNIQQETTRPH